MKLALDRRAQRLPQLPFTTTQFSELLLESRRQVFPEITYTLEAWFVPEGALARICHDHQRGVVFIHSVLNHHRVPERVFRLIAVHELLHLVVRPRDVGGRLCHHPPEFYARERELVSDRDDAWEWIHRWFGEVLRVDRQREGYMVRRNWRTVWRELNEPGEPWMPEGARRPAVEFM